ncbi:MAG: hypothetical protein IJK33_09720 [Clostridia bacterium]|nr:hypothetical protein [Clostridia bacterium]
MGNSFSNIHIRKNGAFAVGDVAEYVKSGLAAKGLTNVEKPDDDTLAVIIYEPEHSEWISVYSELFSFVSPDDMYAEAAGYSGRFNADVLALLCNDSDYLFMNLVNISDGTDAWMKIGFTYGVKIGRRSNRSAWKPKVNDYKAFSAAVSSAYVFADEALVPISKTLSIDVSQTVLDTERFYDEPPEGAVTVLYFRAPEGEKELPRLEFRTGSNEVFDDLEDGRWYFSALSKGGASKGIAVVLKMIKGNAIENGEITFTDTAIVLPSSSEHIPINMEKVRLKSGEWALRWIDKDFRIPAKINDSIGGAKLFKALTSHEITFFYKPQGNKRKFLDILAVIVPLQNDPKGAAVYYPWIWFSSKREYLEQQISELKMMNENGWGSWKVPDIDDYDLDD